MIATALTIAGSDPSGGAGIQADLKTFMAHGVYGMAALTALTAQNTRGVSGVEVVRPAFVRAQIDAVLDDVRVDAVKIGMIGEAPVAQAVAESLRDYAGPVVLDPVMVAKGGARLLAAEAVDAVRRLLVPRATVITPNLDEAADLLGRAPIASRAAMREAAEALIGLGAAAVLLKGGHLGGETSPDLLLHGGGALWLEAARVPTRNTHGTGCTLAAALAARLALGEPLDAAARGAKAFLSAALAGADGLSVGSGRGPVDHRVAPVAR